MKKILHVIRNLKYGGNQRLLHGIIKFSSKKYSHSILVLQDIIEMNKEFEELNCNIDIIEQKKNNFYLLKKKIKSYIKKNNINLVFSWFYPFMLRLEIEGIKYIHHIGSAPIIFPLKYWFKHFMIINFYKNSNSYFIFASKYIEIQTQKILNVKFKNSYVIHNGIDLSNFRLEPDKVFNKNFNIVMVGRMDQSKDFDTLIKITPSLYKIIKNLKIFLVGDGPDRNRLEKLSRSNNSTNLIHFLGTRSDVSDILNKSHIFVFLNKPIEGFGLVLLEAMKSSIPIITYNIGANSEIIDDGLNGFLVDDEKELIQKIILLYNLPKLRKTIGTEAQKKVREKFDIKTMITNYEKFF